MKSKLSENVSESTLSKNKNAIVAIVIMFVISLLWVVVMRFILLKQDGTHYHANFAVFVNGERMPLDNFTFYEEVQSCGSDELMNPRTRVHMHNQISHVAHVHDEAATWGHFFANLGYATGDTMFKTDKGEYIESSALPIRYILNNKEVDTISNRVIESEDTLLVSIGQTDDSKINEQYSQIIQDADDYNTQLDPSNCSGGKPWTMGERLKASLNIFEL